MNTLTARFTDDEGKSADDTIRAVIGSCSKECQQTVRTGYDKDNVIGVWPEHGILGTQLGPNKNGRKW
jgi:Icc protein